MLRDREVFARNFRQVLLVFLFVQILVLKFTTVYMKGGDELAPFLMVAFFLLVFRLRLAEHFMLYAHALGGGGLPAGWECARPLRTAPRTPGGVGGSPSPPCSVWPSPWCSPSSRTAPLPCRSGGGSTRRQRERLRMREEIDYAREHPAQHAPPGRRPSVRWLDLAAASLPATEVGGDYYDYFRLSPTQLALVVGDVAGHGLASGLLLSGVRSCLYLLEEELAAPVEVLERLNPMVRRTTDRRTYVTLLCAVLDRRGRHPHRGERRAPAACSTCVRTRQLEEVGKGAPPLGTFLERATRRSRPLHATGDLLVFYTDGLMEARNAAAVEYGEARLQRAVARAGRAAARPARSATPSWATCPTSRATRSRPTTSRWWWCGCGRTDIVRPFHRRFDLKVRAPSIP